MITVDLNPTNHTIRWAFPWMDVVVLTAHYFTAAKQGAHEHPHVQQARNKMFMNFWTFQSKPHEYIFQTTHKHIPDFMSLHLSMWECIIFFILFPSHTNLIQNVYLLIWHELLLVRIRIAYIDMDDLARPKDMFHFAVRITYLPYCHVLVTRHSVWFGNWIYRTLINCNHK
jgi:hypothetical protein